MKKNQLLLALAVGFFLSAFVSVYTYSEKQLKSVTSFLTQRVVDNDFKPLTSFGDLLYSHVHGIIDLDSSEENIAGYGTPLSYKNGIRSQIAKNPNLVHLTLSTFGPKAIKQFNAEIMVKRKEALKNGYFDQLSSVKEMEERDPDWWKIQVSLRYGNWNVEDDDPRKDSIYKYWEKERELYRLENRDDSIKWAKHLNSFTVANFWKEQKSIIAKYDLLINTLLNLPDSKLNTFITEIGWEQEHIEGGTDRLASNTHAWLLKNKLIKAMPTSNWDYNPDPEEQMWYLDQYPLDLLLFTYRIHKDYPTWTPRKILNEVKKFSTDFKALIP